MAPEVPEVPLVLAVLEVPVSFEESLLLVVVLLLVLLYAIIFVHKLLTYVNTSGLPVSIN